MAKKNEKGDTKRRILRAACELLESGGMRAVTIREVARMVNITPMGIYNHYPSLEALLVAVYERGVDKLARQVWKGIVRAKNPEEKLRALARSYVSFGLENPHYYELLFGSAFIQKYWWEEPPRSLVMQNFWAPLTEVIDACQEAGVIEPKANPQEIATHVWATMHGYVGFLLIGRLQQLWQLDERSILKSMEKHLLAFLKKE